MVKETTGPATKTQIEMAAREMAMAMKGSKTGERQMHLKKAALELKMK